MSVFSTAWINGKIEDIDKLIQENDDREFIFILDTNFAIMARYYITDRKGFNRHYENKKVTLKK